MQCRLDYLLISKKVISKQRVLLFAPYTVHSAVVTDILSEELSRKPGPGFWKFNSALLKDNVNGIRECVKLAKVKCKDVEDHRLSWDLIKIELRGYTIAFAKRKKR